MNTLSVAWPIIICLFIVEYSTVQYSAVQCSAVQCSAVQCSTVQYSAVPCSVAPSILNMARQRLSGDQWGNTLYQSGLTVQTDLSVKTMLNNI